MNEESFFSYDEEFEKTIEEYTQMLASEKSVYFDSGDILKIAIHYQANRNFDEALNAINYGLTLHPDKEELLLTKASILLDLNHPNEARKLIDTLPDPNCFDVKMLLVKEAVTRNDISKGKEILAQMEKEFPPSEDFFLKAAYCFYDKGFLKTAISWFEKAFNICHNSLYDLNLYTNCCDVCQKFDKITGYYKDLVDDTPYNVWAWMGLSQAYLLCQNLEKALESIDFALAIQENNATKVVKATILYEMKAYEKALNIYKEQFEENQQDAQLANFVGMCLYALSHYDEAIAYFNTSLKLNPEPPIYEYGMELYYNLAMSYRHKGDIENTLKTVNILLNYPLIIEEDVYFLKAEMELYKGHFDIAAIYFHEGLECNNFEIANQYITIFYMYLACESLKQLIPLMEKLSEEHPKNMLPLATLLLTYHQLEDKQMIAVYQNRINSLNETAWEQFQDNLAEFEQNLEYKQL